MIAVVAQALAADGRPVGIARLEQLLHEMIAGGESEMLSALLPGALANPTHPMHPFCSVPLYTAWFPAIGRELGFASVASDHPQAWLPAEMIHTRELEYNWYCYVELVIQELDRLMVAEHGYSATEVATHIAVTGEGFKQAETRVHFRRSGLKATSPASGR